MDQDYNQEAELRSSSPAFTPYPPFKPGYNPQFPNTPSYNGSYNNSPFSNHSELSFVEEFPVEAPTEYDPSAYDPSCGESLLLFNNTDNFLPGSVSLTSAPNEHRDILSSYDYSSPSSNGGGDSGPEGNHSRASSVSSQHVSPRLDSQFEHMGFEAHKSPNWGTHPLPQLSPPHKPLSPPQLMIPDSASSATSSFAPPTINAPSGDGGELGSGPQLHIVPATPVSGGGAGGQSVPFQTTLETLHAGSSADGLHPFHFPSQLDQNQIASGSSHSPPYEKPRSRTNSLSSQSRSRSNSRSEHPLDFFLPQQQPQQQQRRSSDASLHEHQQWDSAFRQGAEHAVDDSTPINDRLPIHDPYQQHPGLPHSLTFGPPPGSYGLDGLSPRMGGFNPSPNAPNFLPPNHRALLAPDVAIRRSKSDAGSRPGHARQSRSEDLRFSHGAPIPSSNQYSPQPSYTHLPSSAGYTTQTFNQTGQFIPGHGHSMSHGGNSNNNMLPYPSNSHNDFMSRQFLHPSEPVVSIRGRRASSGSRDHHVGGGAPSGHQRSWSGTSSTRPSPYPSPSASPANRYDELPDGGGPFNELSTGPSPMLSGRQHQQSGGSPMFSGRRELDLDMHGMNMIDQSMDPRTAMSGFGGQVDEKPPHPHVVAKQYVTTARTTKASENRRKQVANFACTVPGCNSTFTRSFNLKGHIRSHNEEKPYQCKWPGCGKGFARQHDCKRHEQLHSNYRPFTCDGCGKHFARMDALNRHLRSEGGVDCQKVVDSKDGPGAIKQQASSPNLDSSAWGGLVL